MKVSKLKDEIRLRNNTGEFIDRLIDILQEFECSDDLGRRIIGLVNECLIVEEEERNNGRGIR